MTTKRTPLPLAQYIGGVREDAVLFFRSRLARNLLTFGTPSRTGQAILRALAGWMRQGVFASRADVACEEHELLALTQSHLVWDCDRGLCLTLEGQIYMRDAGEDVDFTPAPSTSKQLNLFGGAL